MPAASARQHFTTRTATFALGNSRTVFRTGYTVTVTRSQTLTKAVKRFEEACVLFLLFLCVSIYLAYVLGGILVLESSFI